MDDILKMINEFKGRESGREETRIQRINNRFSAKMIEEGVFSGDIIRMADKVNSFNEYSPRVVRWLVEEALT